MKQHRSLWNSLRKAVTIIVLAALLAGVGPVQAQTENPPEALEAAQDNKACLPDIYEPNNTIEQAFLLDPNDSIQAILCPRAGHDYYAVDLLPGQELVVTLEHVSPNHYSMIYPFNIYEYDSMLHEYVNITEDTGIFGSYRNPSHPNPDENLISYSYSFTPTYGGRFYIFISDSYFDIVPYTLHLTTVCKGLFTSHHTGSRMEDPVTALPAGNCDKGTRVYQPGTQVQLQASNVIDEEDVVHEFVRWNLDLTGTANPANIIVDRTKWIDVLMKGKNSNFSCDEVDSWRKDACKALINLYNATDGDHWTRSWGWLYYNDICAWSGVICGGYATLDLRNNGLKGSLPPDFYVKGIMRYDLGENQLGPNLSIDFEKMNYVETLRLDNNLFRGMLPAGLNKLEIVNVLDLSNNQFTGPLPILQNVEWNKIRTLKLAGNQFTGSIPSDLADRFPELIDLDLSDNLLTGSIPWQIELLPNLRSFAAHHNQLTGEIPEGIGFMNRLSLLDLQGNQLTGPIPTSFGNLPLQRLKLSNNRLSGPIPEELFSTNTQNLEVLELANNQFSGEIPAQIQWLPSLSDLRLDGNRLTASDPDLRRFLAWKNPSWVSSQRVPMLQVSLTIQSISAWNFPVNTDLTLTIRDALGAQLFQATAPTDSLGHLFLPSIRHQVALAPGMTVEASDGVTTKSLTLTPLTLDAVDLPAQQVTGTAQPGDLVQVLADNLSQYDRLQTLTDGSGNWDSSDSSWLISTFGDNAQPTEDLLLLPDTRVSARVYDEDGDVTYVQQPICLQLTTQASPPTAGSVNVATPTNCPNGFLQGTTVALEAAPNPGFKLERWSGAVDEPTQPVTQITLEDNTLVTANFVEALPPTVLKLNSFRPTADQQITPGEVITNLPITQLTVHFSEPMYNPIEDLTDPGDVTNPNVYRLTRSGQPVTVNLVVYDAVNHTAKLLLNGGKALESETYTLEIADGDLSDMSRNLLDGDGDGLPGGAYSLTFTLNNIPSAPQLTAPLSRAFLNDTTPTFEWTAGPTDKSFSLQIAQDSAFKKLVGTYVTSISTFTLPDDEALSEGRYFWRVSALNPFDRVSKWSQVWSFTVDTTAPPAPLLRTPKQNTNTTDTTPLLTWARALGAKSYRLRLSDEPSFSHILADTTTLKTSYVLPTAEALPYGRYYWQVQAVDAAGNLSPWSDFFTFDVSFLRSPQDGTYTIQNNPTLRWTRLKTASHYYLEVSRSPNFTPESQVLSLAVPGSDTQWILSPLPYGWYYWRMSAVVDGVTTPWMPAESFAVTPSLGRPTLTSPANKAILSNPAVELVWQEAAWGGYQPPVYQVQVDDTSNFSSPLHDVTLPADALSWVTPDLANGKHYWRVRAVNGLGYAGPWSASGNFTVLAP